MVIAISGHSRIKSAVAMAVLVVPHLSTVEGLGVSESVLAIRAFTKIPERNVWEWFEKNEVRENGLL